MVHRGLLNLNVIHHNVLFSPLILWIWSSPSYCWLILLSVCWQLSPCPQCFLNFGRRKEAMNIHCIWVGSSVVSVITFLLASYVSLCESPSTSMEALWWELRISVICGYKSLMNSLVLYSFNKVILMGSPLGPIACLSMREGKKIKCIYKGQRIHSNTHSYTSEPTNFRINFNF